MSISAIKSHPLATTLSQLGSLQNNKAFVDSDGKLSAEQAWAIERVFAIANRVRQLLNDTPAVLISLAGISNLNSHFTNVVVEFQAFGSNSDFIHILNANHIIDGSILPSMWAFSPTRDRAGQALGQTFSSIVSRSNQAVDDLRENSKKTVEELTLLSVELTESNRKVTDLAEEISQQKRLNSEIVDGFRTSFEELRRTFQQQFHDDKEDLLKLYQTTTKEFEERLLSFEAGAIDQSKKHVQQIEGHEADARRILQIVGNIGLTGNYQNIANEENRQAKFWRWATIFFFSLGVVAAATSFGVFIYHEFSEMPTTASISTFVARFVTAVAIAAPAFYTARESARHRTNSDSARQKELELATLGPFMDSLPDAIKIELKQKLTERYFGNGVETHDIKQPVDLNDVVKLIQSVASIAK